MSAAERAFLLRQQAHDVTVLLARWKRAAAEAGWSVTSLCRAGAYPVLALRTRASGDDGLYLSGGMHGDEPAGAWGLFEWFQAHGGRLSSKPMVVFPCLNPGGLSLNTRATLEGEDLNRQFHRTDHPLVSAWRAWIGGQRFRLALCLHEDYDGQGVYCYELYHPQHPPLADRLLAACEHVIPRDPRPRIDGRKAVRAVVRRARAPVDLPGFPEAIALHLGIADHNLTFESPSEYSFYHRVRVHEAFVSAAVRSLGW